MTHREEYQDVPELPSHLLLSAEIQHMINNSASIL